MENTYTNNLNRLSEEERIEFLSVLASCRFEGEQDLSIEDKNIILIEVWGDKIGREE